MGMERNFSGLKKTKKTDLQYLLIDLVLGLMKEKLRMILTRYKMFQLSTTSNKE